MSKGYGIVFIICSHLYFLCVVVLKVFFTQLLNTNGFQTIVFIFIVISPTFRPIYPPAFFRCLSNLGTFTELRTTSFIESTGVACSDSINKSIWSIDKTQTGTATAGQSLTGSNGNEDILYIPQSSRIRTHHQVECLTHDAPLERSYLSAGDTISMFLALPIGWERNKS